MFFPVCHWPHHFETDLEIIVDALESDNEVCVVRCHGRLPACFMSRENDIVNCKACQSMFNKGMKAAGVPKNSIVRLPYYNANDGYVPPVFNTMEELLSFQYSGIELGMAAASNYTWLHNREHRFDPLKDNGELRRDIISGIMVYSGLQQIVRKIKPQKVVFFNGRFPIVRAMLRLCKQEGIDYQIHERCGDVTQYWLINNSTPHTLDDCNKDILKVWENGSPDKAEKAHKWFIDRRKGVPQGWFSYINKQNKDLLPVEWELHKDKKKVVIYNTTIAEYFGVKEWNFGIYGDQNKAIDRILSEFDNDPKLIFYLRVHPNLSFNKTNSQLIELQEIKKKHKNLILIPPDSPVSSYALLDEGDVVVVFGSTVGVESCYWGKPVILASRSYYESVNACYYPDSHEELIGLLKTDLLPLPQDRALPYAYWEISRGNKFRHFVPDGIDDGAFKGVKIKEGVFVRILTKIFNALKRETSKQSNEKRF